jgi:hypothetical protein
MSNVNFKGTNNFKFHKSNALVHYGFLQRAIEEEDIPKTASRAGFSALYH